MCSRSKPSDSVTSQACRNAALRVTSPTRDVSHSPYSLTAASLRLGIFKGLISFGLPEIAGVLEAVAFDSGLWDGRTLMLMGVYGAPAPSKSPFLRLRSLASAAPLYKALLGFHQERLCGSPEYYLSRRR